MLLALTVYSVNLKPNINAIILRPYTSIIVVYASQHFSFFSVVLGEFPPVEPTDVRAKAFRGIRVDCNTPSYYPGKFNS